MKYRELGEIFTDKKGWLDTKITGNCLSRMDKNYVSFKEIRDEV